MGDFAKIAGICLCAALLGAVLDRRDRALSMAIGLLCCAGALLACIRTLRPVVRFFEDLRELSNLDEALFSPMIKTVGIGVVTQISSAVCTDCGQRAMAKTAEVCGICASVLIGLPLLQSALEIIRRMMGQ